MDAALETLAEMIGRALSLDGTVYSALVRDPNRWWYALAVVFLAGLSEATAQSLVLFLNLVRPKRFGLALVITAIHHLAGYLLWSIIIWLIGVYIFDRDVAWASVACVVGLAYAPRLFAFFSLIPFFGIGISLLLSLWSMLVIVVAFRHGLHLEFWQAALAGGIGWLVLQIWQRTLGLPVYAIDRWIKNRIAGVPLKMTIKDVESLRRASPSVMQGWREERQQTSSRQSLTGHAAPLPPLPSSPEAQVKSNG